MIFSWCENTTYSMICFSLSGWPLKSLNSSRNYLTPLKTIISPEDWRDWMIIHFRWTWSLFRGRSVHFLGGLTLDFTCDFHFVSLVMFDGLITTQIQGCHLKHVSSQAKRIIGFRSHGETIYQSNIVPRYHSTLHWDLFILYMHMPF